MNAQEKLLNEIVRVVELRSRYESLRGMPQVNVEPAIAFMTHSIDEAKKAAASNDALDVIHALQDLKIWEK